jgi:hypothetical protein
MPDIEGMESGYTEGTMMDYAKDQTRDGRPAAQGKRTGTDGKKQHEPARPVFIDLDDAYGVPFSAAPVSVQAYGTDREPKTKPR